MQTIYLDISNKGIIPSVYAKQGDVGRKFNAYLTDSSLPFLPPVGSYFSAWYEGASGSGNYTEIGEKSAFATDANVVTVELITQMLSVPGESDFCLILNSSSGAQIGFWNIPVVCESVPGAGSESAKDYFTAFSKAVSDLVSGGGSAPTYTGEVEVE